MSSLELNMIRGVIIGLGIIGVGETIQGSGLQSLINQSEVQTFLENNFIVKNVKTTGMFRLFWEQPSDRGYQGQAQVLVQLGWVLFCGLVAAKLDADGIIAEWQLHIFGKTMGAKLDANTFYVDQEEGNYLRIQEMALDNLIFRGSMVSEWIAPEKYHWEYRLPHETDPKKYYRVKEGDMPQYNAMPLWVRASCQVIPGPKLQIFLGCAPAENKVSELPGSSDKSFPLIFIEKFSVPFLPFESAGMGLGMGPIPFLIDTRESLDFSEVGSLFPDGQDLKRSMASFLQTGIKPNQRNEIGTWSKELGVGSWVMRAPNHTWPEPRPLAGEATQPGDVEDEDDDEAGQDTNICKNRLSDLAKLFHHSTMPVCPHWS